MGRSTPENGVGSARRQFPSTFHTELILRAYMTSGKDEARKVITTTLGAMCSGGMYDHIGSGFARYSTGRR
ncbi:MAG: hypothetical protein R2697_05270 [Ilumatobacteraceae bacterium]